jgi:GT2 family glycosyltransferase
MEVNLSEFKKNIISWYPIKENSTVLQIGNNEEILSELKSKTNNVTLLESIENIDNEAKFDYIVLIGNVEKIESEEQIIEVLNFSKNILSKDGKILLAMDNKYGMKYWTGEQFDINSKSYETILTSNKNVLSLTKIKNIMDNLKLKYKFYYPLPDYELTNVIYTDEFMPNNDSIDSRVLTYCKNGEILNFSEREAFKQLIVNEKNMFPFFANSYFIEIGNRDNFENIKYIGFSISRNKEYRIQTIIKRDEVIKVATTDDSELHIKNIARNIDIIKKCNIECLDRFENNKIISKYLKDAKSYDKLLMEIYENQGIDSVINKIKEFKESIIDKLIDNSGKENSVFEKYGVEIPNRLLEKLHFTKNGILDLIFQNCLVKADKLYVYDQEWYVENVPVEFILYRGIFYFTELKNRADINYIYEKLGLTEYVDIFEQLENEIQDRIINKKMWKLHEDSVKDIGKKDDLLKNYAEQIEAKDIHIKNLEDNIKTLEKGVNDLNKLIQDKDVELINYANQLRTISNSISWKITKPIRIASWVLNPFNGATFIDRIMPPGGKRRIEYDKKQTEKKYAKKVANYFKLTDDETAEYWKGIDHRKYLKYEKDLEKENEDKLSSYEKWMKENDPTDQELEIQAKTKFKKRPKISIVIPLYNTNTEFFRELLYSIHCQTYSNWELCLADGSPKPLEEIQKMCEKDKRIKYKFLNENKGIAGNTNSAIEMATGKYISLVDHDDMLALNALYEVVKVINENKDVEFIYSDEDKFHFIDEPRYAPHFKPDYAPDTLRANNYICHYSVFKKELLDKIGGFNAEYDGAQDFDIILRATEKAKKIIHIPKVLYYWRIHKGSTSMQTEAKPYAIEAGRKAVAAHLERIGLKGTVFNGENTGTYGIDYDVIGNPKVSILIPNKDGIDLLETCINSVLEKTTYSNYEIIIVENNSDKEETFEYYKRLIENEKIKVINYNKNTVLNKDGENELPERIGELKTGFNYSSIINFGVRNSDGDFIVQLNNDTELITPNWLERMIGFCQRDDVGAVGVKLYYPDETIQHAGIIVGCLQVAAHVFRGLPKDKDGYFGREKIIQNMNAVTAACIMTKRSIYEEVGYMNEEFAVAFNDIDFCLRIRQTGKLIVYNPYVEFVHYESKTRGNDNDPDKIERFQGEINLFLNTWKDKLEKGDEYYNPNLSLDSDQYEIKVKGK